MGGRIAQRIHDTGHPLVGFDVNPERRAAWDLETTDSLAGLVQRVEVVLMCLPDSAVIERVVLAPGGVLEHARGGQAVVDLSTASPRSTVALHAALAEKGVPMVDAGLTGGVMSATSGEMVLMAGGDEADIDRVGPVLATFSRALVRMGGPGAGHLAKVLNNFLNGVALAATSEVMVIAKKAGLDLAQLLDIFNNGSAVNWATRERFPHIIEGDYLEGGLSIDLMLKDLDLYLAAARDHQAPAIVGPGTHAAFLIASTLGYGEVISNHVVDALGDLAGGVRISGDHT